MDPKSHERIICMDMASSILHTPILSKRFLNIFQDIWNLFKVPADGSAFASCVARLLILPGGTSLVSDG